MSDDPIAALAVGLNEDAKAARKGRSKEKAEAADTVAAGAIEGAGAALEAGGDARDVAAAAIGGAAAATAEVTDEDGEHFQESVMVGRMEVITDEAEFDGASLRGDLRDVMLDLFRTRGRLWGDMQRDEQELVAKQIDISCRDLIRRVVHVVRMDGDGAFEAKLEGYTEKGGLKISMTAEPTLDTVIALHNASQKICTIRVADPETYLGERKEPKLDDDQAPLPFESGEAQHPADDSDLAGEADGELKSELDGDSDDPFAADADEE